MADAAPAPGIAQRQSKGFLILYALAWAGGSISYVPLLTILLPVRVETLASGEGVDWLAYVAFAGAVSASIANILFGWLSDITGDRRLWVAAGLVISCILLVNISAATTLPALVALVVIWQFAINLMLGPLAAWAGDCVPDAQKGTLGGLLAIAQPAGALSGAIVTLPGLADPDTRLWLVALMVAACIVPILVFGRPRPFPELTEAASTHQATGEMALAVRNMWWARLLVQIAEAALFAFFYFWLRSLDPTFSDNRTATIFAVVLAATIPVALLTGRWADRTGRPILPLAVFSGLSAIGLVAMGLASTIGSALVGYVLFGISATAFLSLHSAQTLRVLPRPQTRGRDLGIFNLTNTVPSLIMPWIALGLIPVFGFASLFFLLSLLAALAAVLLVSLARPI